VKHYAFAAAERCFGFLRLADFRLGTAQAKRSESLLAGTANLAGRYRRAASAHGDQPVRGGGSRQCRRFGDEAEMPPMPQQALGKPGTAHGENPPPGWTPAD